MSCTVDGKSYTLLHKPEEYIGAEEESPRASSASSTRSNSPDNSAKAAEFNQLQKTRQQALQTSLLAEKK